MRVKVNSWPAPFWKGQRLVLLDSRQSRWLAPAGRIFIQLWPSGAIHSITTPLRCLTLQGGQICNLQFLFCEDRIIQPYRGGENCGMMQPAKHTPSLKPKAENKATRSCQPCSRWVRDPPCKLYKRNSDLGNTFLLLGRHLHTGPTSPCPPSLRPFGKASKCYGPYPAPSRQGQSLECLRRAAARFNQSGGRRVGRGPGVASSRARHDHFGGALGI